MSVVDAAVTWRELDVCFCVDAAVTVAMGPTHYMRGTHTEECHCSYIWGQPLPWGRGGPDADDESEMADLIRVRSGW